MAAPKVHKGAGSSAPKRQTKQVGSGNKKTPAKTGTQTPKGASKTQSKGVDAANEDQQKQLEPVTHVVCHSADFQLLAFRDDSRIGGGIQHEWVLRFGDRGFMVADDKTVAAVQKVLAGEWVDGPVSGSHFQTIARNAGLGIVKHGLETPPLPNWEAIQPEHRVPIAKAAGFLGSRGDILRALRYENESTHREPAREPHPVIVAQLEAELGVLDAGGLTPEQQAHAVSTAPSQIATGAAAPAPAADGGAPLLQTTPTELGA